MDVEYTPEQEKVAKYLNDLTGIGGGEDPIGFLIASHRALVDRNQDWKLGQRLRELFANRRGFEFHLVSPKKKDGKWQVSFCYLRDSGDSSGEFETIDQCLEYAVEEQNECDDAQR